MGQLVGSSWRWPKSLLGLALGKISTFAKVAHGLMGSSQRWPRSLPNQALGKNMGVSQGRSRANLWGVFQNGRGASPAGLARSSQQWPSSLPGQGHKEFSTMVDIPPWPRSWEDLKVCRGCSWPRSFLRTSWGCCIFFLFFGTRLKSLVLERGH
jgi:hypothetical protein